MVARWWTRLFAILVVQDRGGTHPVTSVLTRGASECEEVSDDEEYEQHGSIEVIALAIRALATVLG